MYSTSFPASERVAFYDFLQTDYATLVAQIAGQFKADVGVYKDLPLDVVQRSADGALQILLDGWLHNDPAAMVQRTVKGIIAGVEHGLHLHEALHIISIFRQHLTRASVQAVVQQIHGAVVAIDFYTALLDRAVEDVGTFYYGQLAQSLADVSHFKLIIEAANDSVITTDRHGLIEYANPATLKLLGAQSADELIGRPSTSFFLPEDNARYLEDIRPEMLRVGYWRRQMWMVRLDGARILTEFAGFLLRDGEGELVGFGSVIRDITAQHAAAREREAMQAALLHVQEQTLRELSAPLIPLDDFTMVVPLIGSLDEARMHTIAESLLVGIASHQVRVLIIDITGVPVITEVVGNELLRTASAVRLLGAQIVLTGIRPEVAQTLVALGIDFSSLVTRASLQSGIVYALSQR
jgi:PAS domain S-box-containing protein